MEEETYGYYDQNGDWHWFKDDNSEQFDHECIFKPCLSDSGQYLGYGQCVVCGYYA